MVRKSLFGIALIIAASFLVASTCNNQPAELVTIHYTQLGACNGFNNGSGITSAGPKAAYVAFKLSTIENKDSAARDFTFEPNRVFVNVTPRAFTSTNLNLAQFNPFYATSRFVPKGTTSTING